MPITDYSKTVMYKFVCNDLTVKDCYVGHTTDMTKRKCQHKSDCNNEQGKHHNLKIYQIIRKNGGWSNWSMILIEEFPCKNKPEACKRERELYKELDAKMNMSLPYITQEELKQNKKQYYQDHKEELKQYYKQYYQDHKEDHKQYYKQYREDHKQYHKKYSEQYYQDHKEELKQNKKQYYQDHKEELKKYKKKYYQEHKENYKQNHIKIECDFCNKLLFKSSMYRHIKTCKSKE